MSTTLGEHKSPKKTLKRLIQFEGINRETLQQYRNRIRHLYDGPAGAVLMFGSIICLHEPLVGRMLRREKFDITGCRTILDVGSGAGQILGHLLKRTCPETELIAFDLSHKMLQRARSRLGSDRPSYIAGDLTQLPFADNSFDCVTCGWVIEHLKDPRPGLGELARVLKPGGKLLLLATEDTLPGIFVSRTFKCRTYNRKELSAACHEMGLPWRSQFWFTPLHQFFKIGGILVEAQKPSE
ncbi:MAG: class I SAM-dependent methyltransferase [Planctomycetes bacterium]|nr:class I SAM-dependent methyltransferase [Planctomycetota bacterium]